LCALYEVSPWMKSTIMTVEPENRIAAWQYAATSTLLLPHMLNFFWGFKVIKGFAAVVKKQLRKKAN